MTDLRKAAEMLMKALDDGWVERGDNVAIALRQALAQPEQEPVAWMLPDYGDVLSASEADGTGIYNIPLYTAPPKPEPKSISTNDHLCAMLRQVHDVLACTALPMKRPWVGLTAIDIHVLKMNHDKVKVVYTDHAKDLSVLGQDVDVNSLINTIETILKAKNNAV